MRFRPASSALNRHHFSVGGRDCDGACGYLALRIAEKIQTKRRQNVKGMPQTANSQDR